MRLRLEELRKSAKMSQKELEAKSGVKQSVISDIENGNVRNPRLDTLLAFSHVFKCPIEEMITYKD